MPIAIDEMEVIAEPATPAAGSMAGVPAEGGPTDARPAELQRALQAWAWLSAERQLRLDDR